MKRTLCAVAVLSAVAGAAQARSNDAAAEPAPVYEVLRTGDKDMSCEALAAESNSLNAKLIADQQAAAKKARQGQAGRNMMGGLAGGVLGGAARYGLARGMIGGAFSPALAQGLVAVTDHAAVSVGETMAHAGEGDAAAPTVSPEQQRMNHLLSLYKDKGC